MELELRRDRVRAGAMDAFLAAWAPQVPALRRRFGFELVGAWVVEGRDELVWILADDGPDGFDAADRRYDASPERAALDPDPAQRFEPVDHVPLRPVDVPDRRSASTGGGGGRPGPACRLAGLRRVGPTGRSRPVRRAGRRSRR